MVNPATDCNLAQTAPPPPAAPTSTECPGQDDANASLLIGGLVVPPLARASVADLIAAQDERLKAHAGALLATVEAAYQRRAAA